MIDYRYNEVTRDDVRARASAVGETTVTPWDQIDQRTVDGFAALTGNMDPMHNDPSYVAAKGLFGGETIVNGILLAALIPEWLKQVRCGLVYTTERGYSLNYGLERVRWLSPLPVGEKFRATLRLVDLQEKTEGRFRMEYEVHVHRASSEKPVMVATSVVMIVVNE